MMPQESPPAAGEISEDRILAQHRTGDRCREDDSDHHATKRFDRKIIEQFLKDKGQGRERRIERRCNSRSHTYR